MPTYEIIGPFGGIQEFEAANQQEAIETARSLMPADAQAPPAGADEDAESSLGGGLVDALTSGISFGTDKYMDAALAGVLGRTPGGDYFVYDQPFGKRYERALEAEKQQRDKFSRDYPWSKIGGEFLGAALTPMGMAKQGYTLLKGTMSTPQAIGRGAVESGIYGGLHGAGSNLETDPVSRALEGGLYSALLGGPLSGVMNRAALGAMQPGERAAAGIARGVKKSGKTPAQIEQAVRGLGPEGTLLDVLEAPGRAMGRRAANISPEAREILTGTLRGREGQQNARIVERLFQGAGLPPGSRSTVDELKRMAYAKAQPGISAAYDTAEELGAKIPTEPFEKLLASPAIKSAYKRSKPIVEDWKVLRGGGDVSRLSRWDVAKQLLDSASSVAKRAGHGEKAARMGQLAKEVRTTVDDVLSGPEYAMARSLRQAAFKEADAFEAGAALGKGRGSFGALSEAGKAGANNPEALAQGYATAMAERLLAQGPYAGSLGNFRGLGLEALETSLKPSGAADVMKQVARERLFRESAGEVLQNSTTARQLAEMADPSLAAGAVDLMGGGGIASVGRNMARSLLESAASERARRSAPEMAAMLMGRTVPAAPQQSSGHLMTEAMLRGFLAKAPGLDSYGH